MDYDRLDSIAADIKQANTDAFYVLSTGEQMYTALAADRPDLCSNDCVAYMLARMGSLI